MYIFDEATSNIDVDSEEQIMAVIHELAKTRTVILISHRLANVIEADQVYMLKDGMVIEQGKHCELLAADGEYAGLYRYQSRMEQYAKAGQGTDRKAVAL